MEEGSRGGGIGGIGLVVVVMVVFVKEPLDSVWDGGRAATKGLGNAMKTPGEGLMDG